MISHCKRIVPPVPGETDATTQVTETTTTTTNEPATDEGTNSQQETKKEDEAQENETQEEGKGDESASAASALCLPSESIDSCEASLETRPATAIKASDRSPDIDASASANVDTEKANVNEVKSPPPPSPPPRTESPHLQQQSSLDSSVKISDISQSVSLDTAGDTHSDVHVDAISLSVHPATAGTAGTVDSKVDGSRVMSPSHEPQVFTVLTPPTSAKSRIQSGSGKEDVNANESAPHEEVKEEAGAALEENKIAPTDDNQLIDAGSHVSDRDTT